MRKRKDLAFWQERFQITIDQAISLLIEPNQGTHRSRDRSKLPSLLKRVHYILGQIVKNTPIAADVFSVDHPRNVAHFLQRQVRYLIDSEMQCSCVQEHIDYLRQDRWRINDPIQERS